MTYSTASEIEAAIEQLVTARTLLIALDFDGTLAPEVDDPLEARAIPAAQLRVAGTTEIAQILAILADRRQAVVSARTN